MNDNALHTVAARIREQAAAYCAANHPRVLRGDVHADDPGTWMSSDLMAARQCAHVSGDRPLTS